MHAQLRIGERGARELGRAEVERRREQARGRGDVERACAEGRVRAGCAEIVRALREQARLVARRELRGDLQQQRECAGDVRRCERRASEARCVEAEAIGRADAGAGGDERRELAAIAARRSDARERRDRRGIRLRTDGERFREIAGRGVGRRPGTVVPGGEDRQDVRRPQGLEVGLELPVAGCKLCAPRRIDDIGRVVGRRVAVGIEQPLEREVDAAVGAHARVVEDARRDEARTGRHPDAVAGDDDAHDLRPVAVQVHRPRRVLADMGRTSCCRRRDSGPRAPGA